MIDIPAVCQHYGKPLNRAATSYLHVQVSALQLMIRDFLFRRSI